LDLNGLQFKLHSSKERIGHSHSIALSWWFNLIGFRRRRAKKKKNYDNPEEKTENDNRKEVDMETLLL